MADNNAAGAPSGGVPSPSTPQELNSFVENLLTTMQVRFEDMSKQILSKIDDMNARVDEMEKNIGALIEQANVAEGQPGSK